MGINKIVRFTSTATNNYTTSLETPSLGTPSLETPSLETISLEIDLVTDRDGERVRTVEEGRGEACLSLGETRWKTQMLYVAG